MSIFSFVQHFRKSWKDYPAEVNTLLNHRYTVQEIIGEGSYGITYKCIDRTDGRIVAVKQARPSKGLLAKQLLDREASILQSLRHPQFPNLKDMFTEKRYSYLVMSYISGDNLEHLIFEEGRQYGEQDCIRITMQLLDLVVFIHDHGVVHLDIRIPNVLLKDGQVYLIDFGLARTIGEPPPPAFEPIRKWYRPFSNTSSRPVKESTEQADLQDIGHLMLFILYSSYEPDHHEPDHHDPDHGQHAERSWQDELNISPELKIMIERLLEIREPYASSAEFRSDLQTLTEAYSVL